MEEIGFIECLLCQMIFCIILAGGNVAWRDLEGGDRNYLGFDKFVQGNIENDGLYGGLVFLTFWILTSYMVPISLFVTIEIVKFWQVWKSLTFTEIVCYMIQTGPFF